MNEEMLKALYDQLQLKDRDVSFEQFKADMENNTPMHEAVMEKLDLFDKGVSLEQFQSDLGGSQQPLDGVPVQEQGQQPSTYWQAAKSSLDRGLIQADIAGVGVDILNPMSEVTDEDIANLIALNQASQKHGTSQEYRDFVESKGFGEAIKAFSKDPLKITTELAVESLASFLKLGKEEILTGAAAGTVVPGLGNGVGALIGVGATSFQLEAGLDIVQTFQEEMEERGMDVNNVADWQEMLADEEFLASARRRASTRGGIVAAFDAVTGGLSGKLVRGSAKPLTKALTSTTAEGIGGGAGEVTASLAVGDEITGGGTLAEVIGEFGPGSVTIATQALADPTKKAVRDVIRGTKRGRNLSEIDNKLADIAMSGDAEVMQKMESEIATAMELGEITPDQADQLRGGLEEFIQINETIPGNIGLKERRIKIANKIRDRRNLDGIIDGRESSNTDEAFTDSERARTDELKAERDQINDEIRKESNVPDEVIDDTEYDDFVSNDVVSDERLNSIAQKRKNQETLTDREFGIFVKREDEINSIEADLVEEEQLAEPSTVEPQFNFVDDDVLKGEQVTLNVVNAKTGKKEEVTLDALDAQNSLKSNVDRLKLVKDCL